MNVEHQISSIEHRASRHGFSLTEVLMAVGILAVGMLFIAGVFPVSIYFTTVTTERTIAPIVADEAFAKIKLYGFLPITDINWVAAGQSSFEKVASTQPPMVCFAYPSTNDLNSKYWWSAICRRVDINDIQVTVFVSRKIGATTSYYGFDANRPNAVSVGVTGTTGSYDITITGNKTWINDGSTIVDDATGQIYRVLERYRPPNDTFIKLDRAWQGGATGIVWVVPPPISGGRSPCIGVYQKVMRF